MRYGTTTPTHHSLVVITHNASRPSTAHRNKKVAFDNIVPEQRRNKALIMLGQAVRRFTTSAVRSSQYGEGPGKVKSSYQPSIVVINVILSAFGLVCIHS